MAAASINAMGAVAGVRLFQSIRSSADITGMSSRAPQEITESIMVAGEMVGLQQIKNQNKTSKQKPVWLQPC